MKSNWLIILFCALSITRVHANAEHLTFHCHGIAPHGIQQPMGSVVLRIDIHDGKVHWVGQFRPDFGALPYGFDGGMEIQSVERVGGHWLFLSNSTPSPYYIAFHSALPGLAQGGPQGLNPGQEVFVEIGSLAGAFVSSDGMSRRPRRPLFHVQCARD